MPIKKIQLDDLHPANPLAQVIDDVNANLDSIVEAFENLNGGKGVIGPAGVKGDTGAEGPAGIQGPKGDKGDPGLEGSAGKDGAPGPKGDKGDKGDPGADGKHGIDGRDGEPGKDGAVGPKGDKGDPGSQGLQGIPGLPGKDGANGKDGAQGLPGKDGKDGAQGPQGLKGDTGAQGVQGVAGPKGDTGAQGPGATQKIILNAVAPAALVTGADVAQWSASYTSVGGQVVVRADITAWTPGSGAKNWYLKRNGTTVATGTFFFNAANTHMTLSPVQYTDTTGAGTATWSIAVGAGLNADAYDFATITITETVGMSNVTITKAAAYVDAGVFVSLDNIKCTVTTGGSRGLSVAAVAGSFAAHISGTFGYISGVGGSATSAPITYTTTPSASFFGWSFPNQGDGSTYLINDVTNYRFYRVTLMIGPGYTKNFISIERLY